MKLVGSVLRFLGIVAGALFCIQALAGTEENISLQDVPESIREGITAQFPNSALQSANTETEADGKMVYEVQGRLEDGRKFEFDVFPSGEIEEIEIEFQLNMVPKAVLIGIERQIPGFNPVYIEASHSATMKVVKYEFEGTVSDQSVDIEVSADGRSVTRSDK